MKDCGDLLIRWALSLRKLVAFGLRGKELDEEYGEGTLSEREVDEAAEFLQEMHSHGYELFSRYLSRSRA